MNTQTETVYLNPTTTEVRRWLDRGLCAWCGDNCPGDQCRARKCDSCSEVWKADTLAEVDDGYKLTVEDCGECVEWFANLHLENEAPNFAPADWMRTREVPAMRCSACDQSEDACKCDS